MTQILTQKHIDYRAMCQDVHLDMESGISRLGETNLRSMQRSRCELRLRFTTASNITKGQQIECCDRFFFSPKWNIFFLFWELS